MKTKVNKEKEKRDHALYFIEKPDPNFSPAKNKFIIESSILKYEAMRKKKKHEFDDAYRERADAVVSYLKSFNKGGVDHSLLGYFGEKNIRMLRGDEIRAKIHQGIQFAKVNRGLKRGN
jgi:hypothetical protein